MKQLSTMMLGFLERLAEMFPESTYQSRLEAYLSRYCIDNPAQLEHLQRQFDQECQRGSI
jgi:hypothetical protein